MTQLFSKSDSMLLIFFACIFTARKLGSRAATRAGGRLLRPPRRRPSWRRTAATRTTSTTPRATGRRPRRTLPRTRRTKTRTMRTSTTTSWRRKTRRLPRRPALTASSRSRRESQTKLVAREPLSLSMNPTRSAYKSLKSFMYPSQLNMFILSQAE